MQPSTSSTMSHGDCKTASLILCSRPDRMLLIIFQVGKDRYGIEAQQIEEILPLVEFKSVPRAPAGIVGILNYHGRPVPVLDLTELATGEPSRSRMGT